MMDSQEYRVVIDGWPETIAAEQIHCWIARGMTSDGLSRGPRMRVEIASKTASLLESQISFAARHFFLHWRDDISLEVETASSHQSKKQEGQAIKFLVLDEMI